MPRTYSHTGCLPCKKRKKKCDEQKPVCRACQRMYLFCTYDFRTADLHLQRQLNNAHLSDEEATMIARIPESTRRWRCPTFNQAAGDVHILMQMILTDQMLQNSVVACLSVWFNSKLSLVSLDKALRLIRLIVSNSDKLVHVILATLELGLLDVSTLAYHQ